MNKAKILILDIETAPNLGYVWGLWDQNIALNQIESEWFILSFSAKWLGKKEIMYLDSRNQKNIEDDTKILKKLHKLLNEADVVIAHNGDKFDIKKINARFILNGFKPPKPFRTIDTLKIAKKHFAFTSNKLEYLTDKLCTKYKKQKSKKFNGFSLWKECLNGNKKAFKEMELYNKYDVLSLEELYMKLEPWGNTINFNVYNSDGTTCSCGSKNVVKNEHRYTNTSKKQLYQCRDCGKNYCSGENLLDKKLKKTMLKNI